MPVEHIKVVVIITLCSHLVEEELPMDTQVVVMEAGAVQDSLKLLIGNN
jgi:hypothetical protein